MMVFDATGTGNWITRNETMHLLLEHLFLAIVGVVTTDTTNTTTTTASAATSVQWERLGDSIKNSIH